MQVYEFRLSSLAQLDRTFTLEDLELQLAAVIQGAQTYEACLGRNPANTHA